jgi:hypothetical protein
MNEIKDDMNFDVLNSFASSGSEASKPEIAANHNVLLMLVSFQQQMIQSNIETQKSIQKIQKKLKKSKKDGKSEKKKNRKNKKKNPDYWYFDDGMKEQQRYYGQPKQQAYRGRWDKLIEKSVPEVIDLAKVVWNHKMDARHKGRDQNG